jgi:hypothetical protein
MDTRTDSTDTATTFDGTDEHATPRYQRRKGYHDLPRCERRGSRHNQVRAAITARV